MVVLKFNACTVSNLTSVLTSTQVPASTGWLQARSSCLFYRHTRADPHAHTHMCTHVHMGCLIEWLHTWLHTQLFACLYTSCRPCPDTPQYTGKGFDQAWEKADLRMPNECICTGGTPPVNSNALHMSTHMFVRIST